MQRLSALGLTPTPDDERPKKKKKNKVNAPEKKSEKGPGKEPGDETPKGEQKESAPISVESPKAATPDPVKKVRKRSRKGKAQPPAGKPSPQGQISIPELKQIEEELSPEVIVEALKNKYVGNDSCYVADEVEEKDRDLDSKLPEWLTQARSLECHGTTSRFRSFKLDGFCSVHDF